jgi:PPOX class probable F420-dependent enzyme
MTSTIPESHRYLLNAPVHVALATLLPDGQPQVTPVWASYDGTHIWINTARGRQKEKNMAARPMVTVLSVDPKNPNRWIEVRGRVDKITESGADEHIDALARAYNDRRGYFGDMVPESWRQTMVRVIFKIKPVRVNFE